MEIYDAVGKDTITNPEIKTKPGVYFLWSKSKLMYIGSSCNVKRRIAAHASKNQHRHLHINPNELWKVSVIYTPDRYKALELEDKLLKLIPTESNFEMYSPTNPFLGIERMKEALAGISFD